MKILVFGSLNIDLIYSVDHIVNPGETISSQSLKRSAGGKGANQAAALGKAGLSVYMAGKIGNDGLFLTALLQSYGVNTDNVAVYEGATGQAIIQLDKKSQNAIVLYPGGNSAITVEEVEMVLARFDAGDALVLQNEIPHIREIMEGAKRRGLSIYFNPSPFDQKIKELPLDLVDVFFVNEIEGAAMASPVGDGCEAPAVILERLVAAYPKSEIILTTGKEGAYYGYKTERAKGDVIDVPVVDTTGAGDTFTGYFIAARYRSYSLTDALNIACKAASIAVSRRGAMESMPFAKEVF
ncbi:MAG: ribokinase [Treponema sp.]|jgi:ribokinase|nr:ribokinase [Treponema sp.]